nr:tetratricopeptide repeat protein [Paenibacillus turicensis]
MLQYGTFLVAEKRIKEAMRLYQDILAKDSNSLQAMTGIAKCYQHYGQLQEAKDILELIKEENPSEVIAQVMLADLNMKMISEIRGKLAFATDLNKLKFELAQLYFETDQFEICCNLLEQITAHGGANSAIYLLWGQAKLSLEQYERSKELLYIAKQLAEEEGTNGYDIKVALGEVLLDLNLYEQAQLQLTVAFEMNPLNPHVNYLLGKLYYEQEQFETAIYYSAKAIVQNPENWRFYVYRALSLFRLQRWEETLEDVNFMLSEFRFYSYAWLMKGHCHMNLQQYEESLVAFQKCIDYLHDNYTYFNLAVAYVKLDHYSEALLALDEYMKHYDDIEGYILKGDIYRATGDYEQAWMTYCLGVEQKPTSYIIVQRAVYTYMNYIFPRKEEKVLGWMENILKEYPWDRWMTVNMIRILLNFKSWKEATILASNFYYELEEDDTAKEWASFYTGVAYYHRGNADEAYFWLQYALSKDREPFSLIYSSMACLQLKKNKEALMYAEEAIQLVTDNTEYQQVYEAAKQANQGMMKKLLSRSVISLPELFNLVLIQPEEPSEIEKFFTTLWR